MRSTAFLGGLSGDTANVAARITDLESAGFVFAKPRLKVGGCRQPVTHYSIIENGVEV